MFSSSKLRMPAPGEALPGRDTPMEVPAAHAVNGAPLRGPFPAGLEVAVFGLGCFWGAERKFWQTARGLHDRGRIRRRQTPNPTYEEVCSGRTGHTEVVLVVFDPAVISYDDLLKVFWENHDPTQGMRQGNDVGTQYRSAIYTYSTRRSARRRVRSRTRSAGRLSRPVMARSRPRSAKAPEFYYAEDYHQQYLAKNPNGYCGLGGTGVTCPIGLELQA